MPSFGFYRNLCASHSVTFLQVANHSWSRQFFLHTKSFPITITSLMNHPFISGLSVCSSFTSYYIPDSTSCSPWPPHYVWWLTRQLSHRWWCHQSSPTCSHFTQSILRWQLHNTSCTFHCPLYTTSLLHLCIWKSSEGGFHFSVCEYGHHSRWIQSFSQASSRELQQVRSNQVVGSASFPVSITVLTSERHTLHSRYSDYLVHQVLSTHFGLGSAVAVECIFSGGQDTISNRHASLKSETIWVLMIVKHHLQLAQECTYADLQALMREIL